MNIYDRAISASICMYDDGHKNLLLPSPMNLCWRKKFHRWTIAMEMEINWNRFCYFSAASCTKTWLNDGWMGMNHLKSLFCSFPFVIKKTFWADGKTLVNFLPSRICSQWQSQLWKVNLIKNFGKSKFFSTSTRWNEKWKMFKMATFDEIRSYSVRLTLPYSFSLPSVPLGINAHTFAKCLVSEWKKKRSDEFIFQAID